MNSAVMFSRRSDAWATPQPLFDALHQEFGFGVDAAASETTAKCPRHFGPGGVHDNALTVSWAGTGAVWLNPPYSQCAAFLRKVIQEVHQGCTVVCLVPSRTDTRWFHTYVWDVNTAQPRPGVEVRFLQGRLKFGQSRSGAPFPSVVLVFRP
jgi:phage N-6-adenine-methyltransferase